MENWMKTELRNVIKTAPQYGANASAVDYLPNENLRFVRITDIDDSGRLKEEGKVGISYENGSPYILEEDDIIIARTGATVGKAMRFKEIYGKCAFAGYLIRFKIDENKYDVNFFNQYLLSPLFKKWIQDNQRAGAQPNVNAEEYQSVILPNPPLAEQKKIAEILSTWDKAIETTEKLLTAKQTRKRALMQRLLTGKQRFPQFAGQAWREVKLSDVFERVTRKNDEGNTNVVTISAQRGFVRQNDFFNRIVASDILDNYFLVEKGEFCYNKSYSNGYPWGATKRLKDFEKAVVTTLYICFKFNDETKHSGDFFEHFFESGLLDKGLTKIAHEGGRAHGLLNVTPSDFFALKITIPNHIEQVAIARILQTLSKEIDLLKKQREVLKDQKRGLMQILLTGKVRVKVEEN